MQRKIGSTLFLGALLLVMAAPSFADRGYEAYDDSIDGAPWFDGVHSTIDYQDTTVDAIATAAWSGLDNNGEGGMKWFQGGWVKWNGGDPQIYWEYTDKTGAYGRGYDQAPGASETYEQSHNGANVEWKHDDTVYKTVEWTKFNTIEFRKAGYGAEMLDSPADHTPGKEASKNKFAATAVRRSGGGFANAGLADKTSSAHQGNVDKYGNEGSGNFHTWDSRND